MKEFIFIFSVVSVFLGALIWSTWYTPNSSTEWYADSKTFCVSEKDWGYNPPKRTCYQVKEINQ